MPSPFWVPYQFMKKPLAPWTIKMATIIFAAMPNAATRPSKPTMRPSEPANSAAMARKASGAGMCSMPVKNPMVPVNP